MPPLTFSAPLTASFDSVSSSLSDMSENISEILAIGAGVEVEGVANTVGVDAIPNAGVNSIRAIGAGVEVESL